MKETITMTSREQQRAQVLTRLLVGDMTAAEAALLGLSERQAFRLRAGYQRDGPAAAVHGHLGTAVVEEATEGPTGCGARRHPCLVPSAASGFGGLPAAPP